ncbi:MAG: PilT/PilU family type 4a pilus ATPase [bacterium]|nr:PilT/PilU family type 4a pilus ATPase [bacterium]
MNIQEIFQLAVKKNASDVHLVVNAPILLRVDGELHEIEPKKLLTRKDVEQMSLSLLSDVQKKRFMSDKELDFGYENEAEARFRVNLLYERDNVGLVARVITDKIPTMEDLLMPKVVYDLVNLQQGLILVTGPTGCGKSTTLAAAINYINQNRSCSIVTLEDPIEFRFKHDKSVVIQRQLGTDMVSFADGLKHVLRQDPNVIMVGEMRDLETIAATITLAETGHLVLATLHTYSAAQTIDRVIDIFPPHQQTQVRMQLSMTLAAVISQRLVAKTQGGRLAAREILTNTAAVSNLIRENKIAQIKTVIETSSKDGMISLDHDLKRLYDSKIISKETAQAHMNNPELLEKFRII